MYIDAALAACAVRGNVRHRRGIWRTSGRRCSRSLRRPRAPCIVVGSGGRVAQRPRAPIATIQGTWRANGLVRTSARWLLTVEATLTETQANKTTRRSTVCASRTEHTEALEWLGKHYNTRPLTGYSRCLADVARGRRPTTATNGAMRSRAGVHIAQHSGLKRPPSRCIRATSDLLQHVSRRQHAVQRTLTGL